MYYGWVYVAAVILYEFAIISETMIIDIDECLTGAHNCMRVGPSRAECVNEPGGYRCSCGGGYELNPTTLNQCDGMLKCWC